MKKQRGICKAVKPVCGTVPESQIHGISLGQSEVSGHQSSRRVLSQLLAAELDHLLRA